MRNRRTTTPIVNKTSDLIVARRKGRKIRYQSTVSGWFSDWEEDPFYEARQVPKVESYTRDMLNSMLRPELRSIAHDLGMPFAARTLKRDLVEAILNA